MMAAAQFGITVCSLTLGAVAEPTVAHLLEPVFDAVHLPDGLIHPLGYVIALAVVVFLHLVIGEMVPKNLAMAAPEKTALWLSPGLVGFARLCRPVTAVLGACAQAACCGSSGSSPRTRSRRSSPASSSTGWSRTPGRPDCSTPSEQERLEDALELGTRPVTDVLLRPRAAGDGRRRRSPRAEIEELTVRTGYSRFPVAAPRAAPSWATCTSRTSWTWRTRTGRSRSGSGGPMTTLRAELPLDDALTAMRRAATHLARSPTPSGRVLGLVALEDVLEMLVGEVRDPAHREAPEPDGRRGPGRRGARGAAPRPAGWRADARRPARERPGRRPGQLRRRSLQRLAAAAAWGPGPTAPRRTPASGPAAAAWPGRRGSARPGTPDSRRSR